MFSSWLLRALPLLLLPQVCLSLESPNFLFILTDDQSWVGTSVDMIAGDNRTRSDYYQTPQIERLAAMGMKFSQGYAPAASCSPTRRALQVGKTPARHMYQRDLEQWLKDYRGWLSIPQMLKAANPDYRTAHFGKWDMRFDKLLPEEMGYDDSDGHTSNAKGGGKNSGAPAAREDPKLIDSLTQRASSFMAKQVAAGRPFYVQVSHYAVHLDVFYREETLKGVLSWEKGLKHDIPEFAAMTTDLDGGIGALIDKVSELGIADNTYIIFMSDNGGRNFIPHSPRQKQPRNYPLRDGKHSFYEGGIRVPFIVVGPGITANVTSAVPVTGLDILPTLADLAGYPQALPEDIDGGSLKPVLFNSGQGEVQRAKPFFIFHQAVDRYPLSAIIMDDYKLVKLWDENKLELYDISKDLSEEHNLLHKLPRKAEQMNRLLMNFLTNVDAGTKRILKRGK